MRRMFTIFSMVACLLALSGTLASATLISVDTSSLNTLTTYWLYFSFTDGDDPLDATNNTATITGFGLGGGSLGATDPGNNGFSGSIATPLSTLMLDDTFTTIYFQQFTPGLSLTFNVNFPSAAADSGVADVFAFGLTDISQFVGLPTTANDVFGTIAYAEINGSNPPVQSYELSSLVPEPSMVLLFLTGAVLIVARRRATANAQSLA